MNHSKSNIEPAKRAVSVKPGVERSGTPGTREIQGPNPRSGRQRFVVNEWQHLRYRTLRALGSFDLVILGFRFASLHPRLYASARFAG